MGMRTGRTLTEVRGKSGSRKRQDRRVLNMGEKQAKNGENAGREWLI